jgi:paraquat-inducible protein B
MADTRREPELPDLPEAVSAPRRRWAPQLIWIIPIVAVLAGGWLAVKTILERGPTITISFKTGEGLEAGKTKIKYRDVDIGLVKEIALSDDRKRVVATAELDKHAAELLVEDTRFWVVRPRITAGGVSGLGTLLSGPYIAVDPGHGKETRRDFVALDVAPIVTREEAGRQFVLRADDLGSHDVGVPVYFRRLPVGEVVSHELDKDGKGVSIKIFVRAPFDQYVTANTRFWNASGVDVSLDATGVRVQTESLISILIGGIAFQAPPDGAVALAAEASAVFYLFATRDAAMKAPDTEVWRLVFVFEQSVRGLAVGAPVDFRGVTVGEVARIALDVDPNTLQFVQPVEIRFYPDRMRMRARHSKALLPPPRTPEERLTVAQRFVERGFRAQLRTGNLLTGQSYIALDFFPRAPKAKLDTSKDPIEIPTVPGALEDLQETIASIAKRLDKVQYEKIGADVQKALASLDQTLQSADGLVKRLDSETTPELTRALEDARRTLKSAEGALATESPLQTDLRESLREISRAAAAIRALADSLDRQPQSLIFGKPAEEPK